MPTEDDAVSFQGIQGAKIWPFITNSCSIFIVLHLGKVKLPPTPRANRAFPIPFLVAIGHTSADAMKATAGANQMVA